MAFDNSDYFADGTPPLRLDPRKSGYPQRVERHNAKSSNLIHLTEFQGGIFWIWYANSILYSGVVAILTILVSAMAGFALAKFAFKGKNVTFFAIVASLMMPPTVIAIPLFVLEGLLHLRNTYLGVMFPLIVSAFGVYFLRIYISDVVPNELIEAGRVDGASWRTIFFRIVMPVIKPAAITLFFISFIGTWNNFFLPLVILQNSRIFPVTLGLESWLSNMNTAAAQAVGWYPLIITGALVSIVPIMVGFAFLSKHVASGLVRGSINL